jgi:Na+/melibiose symporter-like transporter
VFIAGIVIAIPCVKTIIGWLDKRETLLTGIAIFIPSIALPLTLRLFGLFPENGTDALYYTLATFNFVFGFAMGLLLIVSGSVTADVADDHELKVGLREEGMLFGFIFFAMKTASGLGKFIAGITIDLINFPADVQPDEVPLETLSQLGILYGPGVGVVALVAFFVYAQYDINRHKHQDTLYRLGRQ